MKARKNDGLTLSHRLANFLLTYRTTAHSTTGAPPSELLMGRTLRTRCDLLKPDVRRRVEQRQAKQKERHDQHARLRTLQVGQAVMAKNFGPGDSWLRGVVARQLGPVTYLVNLTGGRLWKRHLDHLKELSTPPIHQMIPITILHCRRCKTKLSHLRHLMADPTRLPTLHHPIRSIRKVLVHPNHPNRRATREPRSLHRLLTPLVIRHDNVVLLLAMTHLTSEGGV